MLYAKSLHFGELLKAEEATEYEAKYLNMVCDCCGETVFHRREHTRTSNGKEVKVPATWAHRAGKDKTEIELCELRCSSMTVAETERRRSIARKQTMVVILDNLHDIFLRFGEDDSVRESARDACRVVRKSIKTYPDFYHKCYSQYKKSLATGEFLEQWDMIESRCQDRSFEPIRQELDNQNRIYDKKIALGVLQLLSTLKLEDFALTLRSAIAKCTLLKSQISAVGIDPYTLDAADLALFYSHPKSPEVALAFLSGLLVTIDWTKALAWARGRAKSSRGFGLSSALNPINC